MTDKKTRLAIDGGKPVRSKPLPAPYLGASILGKEELELLTEVIEKKLPFRAYGDGIPHMVNDFENEARAYFNMPYALALATGSASFYCAMAGIGVGPGDEVIIPAFSWYTDFEAPVILGATPVFADIDRTMNMDPDDFERKITSKTKAVIVVHFQGGVNNMDRLLSIAKERNILVVEDCAQSCGASYKGNKVGSLGDVSCFSFQQNKTITTGDGGLLLARDPTIYERAVRFHDLGFVRPSFIEQLGGEERGEPFSGLQFRMNEFTGAVALAQLRKLDCCILDITRRLHRRIREQLITKCTGIKFRQADDIDGDAGIAFYIDLDTPDRAKRFSEALAAEGIRVGPSSSCSNILQDPLIQSKAMVHPALPPFGKGWPGESVQYSPDLCPNCDRILQSMLCVALVPHMTDGDADDVAEAIVKVWNALPLR